MITLLITLLIFAGIVGLIRTKLADSPFRDRLFLPWGEIIDLPPKAQIIWGNDVPAKPSNMPPEAKKAPANMLALLVNRDRLARPLLATLIDMALRGVIRISWNPRSDDFVLQRQPIDEATQVSKLDRAMLSKLFPNEATELSVEWRNSDLLGEARRLVERANKKRVGTNRMVVPTQFMAGLVVALVVLILYRFGGTEAGTSGYVAGLIALVWPMLLLWTGGLAMKARRASKATGISRYQDRFYLMATLSLGAIVMMVANFFVVSIALGIIGGFAIILAGFSIPLLRSWFRRCDRFGKGHKIAAMWLAHFRANERQERDPKAAITRLDWSALSTAIAVGAEDSWMAAAQLYVELEPDLDGTNDDSAPIENSGNIDPDNPMIPMPQGISFEQKRMPLLALHHHLADGLWVDLWQALLLDYLMRLRQELPIGKKPKA
ncbi:MAG: hypothetical protein AAF556_11240, partial [Pseudomonadota bacterium]